MLYAFLGLVALFGTLAVCRFVAAKANMSDCERHELDARRLMGDLRADDVQHLREENAIMRNLLLDMIENEASLFDVMDPCERTRRSKARAARRRELFGEAVVLLDKGAAPKIRIPNLTS